MNKKNNNIKKLYPKEGISWKWGKEIGKAYSNKDGKIMNGHYEYYHDDGTISQTGIWTNGIKEGAWQSFRDNGELMARRSFKDGKKDGLEENYWKNGQLRSKGNYKNGEYDGLWIYYSSKGHLESKEKYKDGEWLWYEVYYENNLLSYKAILKNNKLWEREEYYPNGQLFCKDTYKDRVLEGPSVEYYEDGTLKSKENYKDGRKHGLFEYYHENGQLSWKGNYKDGKMEDGPSESYLKNRELSIKRKTVEEIGDLSDDDIPF